MMLTGTWHSISLWPNFTQTPSCQVSIPGQAGRTLAEASRQGVISRRIVISLVERCADNLSLETPD